MVWTRLGGEFFCDPDLLDLPRGTRLMHVEALVFCNDNGTDGALKSQQIRHFIDEKRPLDAARKLQAAGLWEETATGWQIVGFTDQQMSAKDAQTRKDKWTGPTMPSLNLAEFGPRWAVRGYASDPPLTIELSDVVRLLESEMGGAS